jgi:hypothetical protein
MLLMHDKDWVLIDTETTGFTAPIIVVELAAQKMRGWEPLGPPFQRLLNQNSRSMRADSRARRSKGVEVQGRLACPSLRCQALS